MAKTIPTQEIADIQTNLVDEMEAEIIEKTAETPADTEKKAKEPKIGSNQVGTSALAEMLGITSRDLRMFLRKHFRNMGTEKGKTYVWEKGSKELQEIIDAYKSKQSAPKAPKADKAATSEKVEAPAAEGTRHT